MIENFRLRLTGWHMTEIVSIVNLVVAPLAHVSANKHTMPSTMLRTTNKQTTTSKPTSAQACQWANRWTLWAQQTSSQQAAWLTAGVWWAKLQVFQEQTVPDPELDLVEQDRPAGNNSITINNNNNNNIFSINSIDNSVHKQKCINQLLLSLLQKRKSKTVKNCQKVQQKRCLRVLRRCQKVTRGRPRVLKK